MKTICEVYKNAYYLRLRLFKNEIKFSLSLYAILCTSLFFFIAFPVLLNTSLVYSPSRVYNF